MDKEDSEYAFSKEWHNDVFPTHSCKQGHYCLEWDDMYICEDCMEFGCCECEFIEEGKKD